MTGLPDYAEALAAALQAAEPLNRVEKVSLQRAGGRVLAEAIRADRDLPPFNRAQMDGYALRASEFAPDKAWPVAHVIAAGTSPEVRVPAGQCVAIATGAPLPADVDTVIQHEHSDRGDLRGKPVRFTVDSVVPGQAVHLRGADAKAGDVLIPAATILDSHHLGIAAAVGQTSVVVFTRPRAIILTSGDEVVAPDSPVQTHQIRNSNGIQIWELLRRFGAEPVESRHLSDERQVTIEAVQHAIDSADLVITVGGVSAGDRDHFPAAFESCGVKPYLHGASIQPGRPVYVGRADTGAVVVGLPGNPVSVLACACLFVWPIVRVMLGLRAELPWREVVLGRDVKPNAHRRAFRPAILQRDDSAIVPSWAGSGDLAHTAPTHGLIELPVQAGPVQAAARLRFLPWP